MILPLQRLILLILQHAGTRKIPLQVITPQTAQKFMCQEVIGSGENGIIVRKGRDECCKILKIYGKDFKKVFREILKLVHTHWHVKTKCDQVPTLEGCYCSKMTFELCVRGFEHPLLKDEDQNTPPVNTSLFITMNRLGDRNLQEHIANLKSSEKYTENELYVSLVSITQQLQSLLCTVAPHFCIEDINTANIVITAGSDELVPEKLGFVDYDSIRTSEMPPEYTLWWFEQLCESDFQTKSWTCQNGHRILAILQELIRKEMVSDHRIHNQITFTDRDIEVMQKWKINWQGFIPSDSLVGSRLLTPDP